MTAAALSSPSTRLRAPSPAAMAHIPGSDGWPLVGNTLQLLADPKGFVERMAAAHGPVYRTHVFGQPSVTLLGPDANAFFFLDPDKVLSSREGWAVVLERLFPRGLMLRDFEEHRLHRKALSVAFKAGPMRAYLAQLDRGISARVGEWRSAPGPMLFYPAAKRLTLDLAATSFLGADLGPEADAVTDAFVAMVAAAVTPIRAPLPFTPMRRGVRGRETIVAYFRKQIPARREGAGEDLFSHLCRATHENGALLSADDVVDHMSFLMMAAHDTLTSSLTSLVWLLAANPDWQERLRAEVDALGLSRDAPLPFEKLDAMPLTEMAFKEAMRINPPVPSIPRRALRPFQFGGYEIPAGTGVNISPLHTHHMPEVWPEPARFDPLRFSDEAVRARHKFAWVPFGGGAHMCLGLHFAYMQAKCFVRHLLGNVRVSVAPGYVPGWQMWPIPKPTDGLRVTVAAR